MNIEKYKNDGWGISQKGFHDLYKIITEHEKSKLSILEFGSGISTQFFVDIVENKVKDLTIESYDNDLKWCFKHSENYDFLNLKMRDLVECDNKNYASMFINKKYDQNMMTIRTDPPHTRQNNCFYNIQEDDLRNEYDIVVLDGPNGNGRSFAFLHLNNILKHGSYIFIDDHKHHPFIKTLKYFFKVELYSESDDCLSEQYAIYKILKD